MAKITTGTTKSQENNIIIQKISRPKELFIILG